ncbi:MAG: DNA translocase FtsK 4TM domain-containing protein [Chloroflexi bacterium]|nr:DNA translocase FtsK 4TM domain-containing protein [Chloroflexota bacterium]
MAKAKKVAKKQKRAGTGLQIKAEWFAHPEIAGVILVFLAGGTALTLLFPGGSVGRQWDSWIHALFGWGSYLLPLLFASFGLGLVWQRIDARYRLRSQEAGGWLLLFAVCLSFLQLIALDPDPAGDRATGGGYVGYGIYRLLVTALGPTVAVVVLLIFGGVGISLALNVAPGVAFRGAIAACRRLFDWYRGLWAQPSFKMNPQRELPRPEESAPTPDPARKPAKRKDTVPAAARVEPPAEDDTPELPTTGDWQLAPVSLLQTSSKGEMSAADVRQKVKLIEDTLADFNVQARVMEVSQGPTVTQFGIEPGFHESRDRNGVVVRREKVKVSEITSLANDLALALAAPTIRIEAPVPGRTVVGIEVPNSSTSLVSLRGVMETEKFQKVKSKSKLAVALGENVSGQPVVADLAKMPHLLVAGATGSGKSVCLNALITCLLLQSTPDEVRLILIDPKRVELVHFNDAPHLLRPVVVEVEKAVGILKWATFEMSERLKKFEQERARNIDEFNKAVLRKGSGEPIHYVVIVIDELADLMMTAPEEVERNICRLAQLARATGIHLVIATQRPSVDVITGLIKANFPTRISFNMTSAVDSRTILDTVGAEKLLGRGDMLYMAADAAKPTRLQGVYVSDDEIEDVVRFWRAQGPAQYVDTLQMSGWSADGDEDKKDELYEKAIELARQHRYISTSLIQRRLRVGYNRAARLMEQLEEQGIVGRSEDGRSREVLVKEEAEAGAVSAMNVDNQTDL